MPDIARTLDAIELLGQGDKLITLQLVEVIGDTQGVMAIAPGAVGQGPPSVVSEMERIFLLAHQGLEAQLFFQLHLIGQQMGLVHHPSDHW